MTIPKFRTALALRHAKVIDNAPVEMKAGLKRHAIAACERQYEATADLDFYLDMELFYYGSSM